MSVVFWIVLVVVSLAALWFGVRYVGLVRAIHHYEKAIREEQTAAAASELAALGRAIRVLVEDRSLRLSSMMSERDRLAAVLDQMTDGVLIAGIKGDIQYSNPAAGRLLGVPSPIGRSVTEALRDHRLVQAWQRSRLEDRLQRETVDILARQQSLQLIVMPDSHGGGSLLLVQDLTHLRRLETVRRDFVANFSHELRTPLASLRALAETLMGGAMRDPEAGARFLQRMITEVDALTQMSEELLELSAIESGETKLQLEDFSPGRLLDAAAERMRLQADRAAVVLRVEASQDIPDLRADFARLEQVLVNLIHNAIKFTAPAGEVALSARRVFAGSGGTGVDAVEFAVRDTGRGIAAEDLPRIFERFYRANKARSKGGTGLGLSIARHIVEAHGGRIWAESEQGRGSAFFFTVPRLDPR